MGSHEDDFSGQVDGENGLWANPVFARGFGEAPFARAGSVPWKMWGGSQTLSVVSGPMGVVADQTQQLLKVSYKRPERWQWMFHVKLESVTPEPDGAGTQSAGVIIDFKVTTGLGRSLVQIPRFERFQWRYDRTASSPSPVNNPAINPLYSSEVFAPNRLQDSVFPSVVTANRIDRLVAQDIQVEAVIQGQSVYVNTMVLTVSAFFSPAVHIRPEWLIVDGQREQQFPGDETGGT